jgi:hypothetical protein
MRAALAALAALLCALVLAAPAGAAPRSAPDVVITNPSPATARAIVEQRKVAPRYAVNDGAGRSVDISESALCAATCTSHDLQGIANFLGTLPHGDEMSLLAVHVVAPAELAAPPPDGCGTPNALACYFPGLNNMVISGNESTASDGATREYVIAHEYGHHLASHRNNAPFANPSVDWGPKNWASFAGVCAGVKSGRYFPGDEGSHYYDNPGEAFAESYARTVFPTSPVPWEWPDFPDVLTSSGAGTAAIQQDALHPWNGDHSDPRKGRFGHKRKVKRQTKTFATPLDGVFTLTLKGADKADLALKLKGPDGRTLARSDGVGSHEQVTYSVCGERLLTAVVKRHGRRKSRYKVTAVLP